MSHSALVSIIIPVYNCERYLAQAIQSALDQTYRETEIIVIDDGSTDSSAETVKHLLPAVRYLKQPHSGTASARNQGVRLSRGHFLSFLDADDLWVKNKLELQMETLSIDPDIEAVFSHVQQFFSPELDSSFQARIHCPDQPIPGWLPTTMVIRRDAFFRIGWFETRLKIAEDMSWILRSRDQNLRTVMLPDILYHRRLHENNKGLIMRKYVGQRLHIVKAHLDRQRKKGV
ncbi:MAG: glycosyltransferase family 2 protein [Anaerolineales bacterium]|nr:glycosyltransferase family 2 protein [Anaerolineales bacterium]